MQKEKLRRRGHKTDIDFVVNAKPYLSIKYNKMREFSYPKILMQHKHTHTDEMLCDFDGYAKTLFSNANTSDVQRIVSNRLHIAGHHDKKQHIANSELAS